MKVTRVLFIQQLNDSSCIDSKYPWTGFVWKRSNKLNEITWARKNLNFDIPRIHLSCWKNLFIYETDLFQDRIFYHIIIFHYMFPIYVCFQTKIMFPIYRICFQTLLHVSNILFLFPISDVCFQYTFYVSKRQRCFQTTMFPMYVSNIHGAAFPITLI